MTDAEYDAHIAVSPAGEDTWQAQLEDGWRVGGGVNGGYVLGVIGNALRGASPDKPDPLVVSAYFVGPAVAGEALVRTQVRRKGGSTSTFAAELEQNGRPCVTALATYGDLSSLPDDVQTTATEPQLPPVEECISNELAPPEFLAMAPIQHRLEIRFDPASAGWAMGKPSMRGVLQGWFRLHDREPDPISLLTVVDAFPPVTFDLGRMGWAPTMELTAHVRAVPAPGWLKVRMTTANIAGGMFEEDCEVWDSSGRLVAQSRQLARQPR